VVERFLVSTLLTSENPKQMFSLEVVRLPRKDSLVVVLGLIQPALLMELYGLLERLQ
jgi:hypothetical protein